MQLGGTAQFDTRVTFIGGGAQQHKQKVNLLQLFKDGRQVYRCRNWSVYANSPCTSEGRFAVTMQGSDKFDFYLSMSNATVNDSGSYVVKLEVIHPETGSYSSIQKTITLTVEVGNGKRFSDMAPYIIVTCFVCGQLHCCTSCNIPPPQLSCQN